MSVTKELYISAYEAEEEEREEFKQWKESFFKLQTPFQKMGFYGKAK